jgi:hypothetical protein
MEALMIPRRWAVVLLLLLLAAPAGQGQQTAKPRIEALIAQLGSDRFRQREQAMAELEAVGAPALPALRRAAKSRDTETARRAAELVRRLEEQLLAAQALAPKKIRLQLHDQPVLQAVSELARQSGYIINVNGDRTAVLERKVSLDGRELTFWEALDQLGVRGGVALTRAPRPVKEATPAVAVPGVPGRVVLRNTITRTTNPPPTAEPINLLPGKPAQHVSYAGAARVELHLERQPHVKGEAPVYQLFLEAAAEPRLQSFTLLGTASLKRAIDEQGRTLPVTEDTLFAVTPGTSRRQVVLSLRPELSARTIKELSGSLPARVALPNEVLVSINLAALQKAGGRWTAQSKDGGALHVNSFEQLGNGDYRVQVVLENLGPNPGNNLFVNGNVAIQGNIVVMGNAWNSTAAAGLPELLDGQGRKYQIVQVPSQGARLNNNQFSRQYTIVYRAQNGWGAPSQLVVYGSQSVTIPIPFSFRDVALD